MEDRGGRKWLILGCLGLVGIVALLVATVAGLTWRSIRSAELQSSTLVHERPERDPAAAPQEVATIPGVPLNVLLELDSCEVYIEPGAPGEPLGVEAHYDANDYRLEEIVDEADPHAYHLRFLVAGSRLITSIKHGLRGGQPQLRIRLPVDTPIELKLVQRNGGAIVDFSGLQLTTVDFDIGGALLKVDADQRLQGTLERLVVEGDQGGVVLESLNLMQPRHMVVDFRMGQAMLDFRGPWAADATIDLSMSLADTIVRLPRGVRVEGIGTARSLVTSTEEIRPQTLTFTVESGRRTSLRVFD